MEDVNVSDFVIGIFGAISLLYIRSIHNQALKKMDEIVTAFHATALKVEGQGVQIATNKENIAHNKESIKGCHQRMDKVRP